MAAPVIAMVGIAAASTLVQFINSERGRRLAKEERKRLEKLINKLEAPQFDTQQLTPPELKVLEPTLQKSQTLSMKQILSSLQQTRKEPLKASRLKTQH